MVMLYGRIESACSVMDARAAVLERDRAVRVESLVAVREVSALAQFRQVVPEALVVRGAGEEFVDRLKRSGSRLVVVSAEERRLRDHREVDGLRAVREFDGEYGLVMRLARRVLGYPCEVERADARVLDPVALGFEVLREEPDLVELVKRRVSHPDPRLADLRRTTERYRTTPVLRQEACPGRWYPADVAFMTGGSMGPVVVTLLVGAVIGGFVGGYATDSVFSVLWAAIGGVGTLGVAAFLGWRVHVADEKKKKEELPPEMRAVFDRMLGVERDSRGRVVNDPNSVFSGNPGSSDERTRRRG